MDNKIINKKCITHSGYLSLIIGPMFSGKTTTLINLYKKYTLSNIPTIVINYIEDKRYHNSKMSTHDKVMVPCNSYYKLNECINEKNIEKYDVFLINEGQFFSDLKDTVIKLVETYKKTVYVCGLDGDFKRNKFNEIMDLIPLCDEVIKKKSICKKCRDGTMAIFSHRITNETCIKVIGSENYIPLCRNCYIKYNS